MSQRTEETEINNIFFCYKIGITHTAIWTKEKQYSAAIPNHFKMSFGFPTPANFLPGDDMLRTEQIKASIDRRIREKADEQHKTGKFCAIKIEEIQAKKRR